MKKLAVHVQTRKGAVGACTTALEWGNCRSKGVQEHHRLKQQQQRRRTVAALVASAAAAQSQSEEHLEAGKTTIWAKRRGERQK